MTIHFLKFSWLILVIVLSCTGCKEQQEQALEYFETKPEPDSTDLERFGFENNPTPKPTAHIEVPFDNERTRRDAQAQ